MGGASLSGMSVDPKSVSSQTPFPCRSCLVLYNKVLQIILFLGYSIKLRNQSVEVEEIFFRGVKLRL